MEKLNFKKLDNVSLTDADKKRLLSLCTEDDIDDLNDMIRSAEQIARPVYVWKMCPVSAGDGKVDIDGMAFDNPLVVKKLSPLYRCFPCVQSCGPELESWSRAYASDPLAQYWAEEIKRAFLGAASRDFTQLLRGFMGPDSHIAALNPGSLAEWPLTGQTDLFALLGRNEVKELAGVTLTPSLLMLPAKTVSGIWFESGEPYQNCMYCPRKNCPGRRGEYRENEKAV